MISIKKIEDMSRKIFENSFEISLLQDELESMLNAIYKNASEFKKGKLSRNAFKANEKNLKGKSVAIIKNVKDLTKANVEMLDGMKNEVVDQEPGKKARKKKR